MQERKCLTSEIITLLFTFRINIMIHHLCKAIFMQGQDQVG
jgi:hypothetical protein